MQTFLAFPSYLQSVRCLDPTRLGNQIYNEGMILVKGGWPHHPASKMWRGHEHSLASYLLIGLQELTRRGFHYPHHYLTVEKYLEEFPDTGLPFWLGDPKVHASHRSNLLRKNPRFYGQFGWSEPDNLPYVWPV